MKASRALHWGAVVCFLSLILLGLAWELWLAPLRPGGSWLALKVIPLILAAPGVLRRNHYTLQWSSMLSLIYLAEGVVRASTDHGTSAFLGAVEILLVSGFFICTLAYLYPYKRAAVVARRSASPSDVEKS